MSGIDHITLSSDNKLRACTGCRLIKSEEQFLKEGCNNCGYTPEEMKEYMTADFMGIMAITNPKKSWCAKYLKLGKILLIII
ncbi:MAG: hypothetical protein MJ252_27625 [archaeon]|nr:hypothetical protein [archaeon]